MKKRKVTVSLGILMIFLLQISQAQNPSRYDPNSGSTIYHRGDGGTTIYSSRHDRVTTKDRNGKTTSYDCKENEKACKEELEDAAGAETPDAPAEGGEGGETQTQSLSAAETAFFDRVFSEFKTFSKGKNGKLFYRTDQGSWSVVQNWTQLHGQIIAGMK